MSKKSITKKATFKMDTCKKAFDTVETVLTAGLYETATDADPIQFGHDNGRNGNGGFIIQYGEGAFKGWSKPDAILEVWDNSAEGRPNIAFRPCKALKDRLPLTTWRKFDCVSNFSNGGEKDYTFRFRAYKSDSDLCVIMARLVVEAVKEARRRKKKATAKKATAKKTEKAVS